MIHISFPLPVRRVVVILAVVMCNLWRFHDNYIVLLAVARRLLYRSTTGKSGVHGGFNGCIALCIGLLSEPIMKLRASCVGIMVETSQRSRCQHHVIIAYLPAGSVGMGDRTKSGVHGDFNGMIAAHVGMKSEAILKSSCSEGDRTTNPPAARFGIWDRVKSSVHGGFMNLVDACVDIGAGTSSQFRRISPCDRPAAATRSAAECIGLMTGASLRPSPTRVCRRSWLAANPLTPFMYRGSVPA